MAIDLAKELARGMIKSGGPLGVRPMTLVKVAPGTRTAGNASAGNNSTEASYDCYGFVGEYSAFSLANSLVRAGSRKISILGGSLDDGIIPAPTDKIIDEDGTVYRIVTPDGNGRGGVEDASNGAIFECQCMK